MDVDAVADCFQRLQQAGKVQHFGVSNFTLSQFTLLQSRLESPLVTNQVEVNPLNMGTINDGTLDQLQQNRVRPMAWSCLAGGRVFSETSEQIHCLKHCLERVAKELSEQVSIAPISIDQVLYAWVMALPSKPVVIAPMNSDSGTKVGQRRIRGGRHKVRIVLFTSMMSAIQHHSKFKPMYRRLVDAGKPKKAALIACARKQLVILNTMMKNGEQWDPAMI